MEMLVRVGAQPRLPSQLRGRTVAVKQPEKRWSRAVPCARRGARRCLTATAGCATTQSGTWLKWRVPSVRIAPECATRMRAGQLRQAPLHPPDRRADLDSVRWWMVCATIGESMSRLWLEPACGGSYQRSMLKCPALSRLWS
jgi:hypothetical protein